jgi:hypothetical protein
MNSRELIYAKAKIIPMMLIHGTVRDCPFPEVGSVRSTGLGSPHGRKCPDLEPGVRQ